MDSPIKLKKVLAQDIRQARSKYQKAFTSGDSVQAKNSYFHLLLCVNTAPYKLPFFDGFAEKYRPDAYSAHVAFHRPSQYYLPLTLAMWCSPESMKLLYESIVNSPIRMLSPSTYYKQSNIFFEMDFPLVEEVSLLDLDFMPAIL